MDISERKRNKNVCAVISAAGLSSRMGRYKPLLPFGGSTVAQRCVDRLRQAGVGEIILVTGFRGEELRNALAGEKLRFVENPAYGSTQMFDSLRLGLAALPADCGRVLIQPIDMPAILPDTIRALLCADGAIVRPRCGGESGHPLLLDAALVPQILSYAGDCGLRGALAALSLPVSEVDTADVGVLLDADTPEDYARLLRLEEERA